MGLFGKTAQINSLKLEVEKIVGFGAGGLAGKMVHLVNYFSLVSTGTQVQL